MTEERFISIQPVNLEDFFRLEYRSGDIRSLQTAERMHLVPAAWWDKLNETLARELEENGPPAIHLIGYTLGAAMVRELKANIGDTQALAKHLTDFAAAAGWGVISLTGDLREGKSYVVSVMNCVFCENESIGQSPVCTFLSSTIEGMADTIYGSQHKVLETRCAAMGEALCQFIVEEGPSIESHPTPDTLAYPDWESLWASPIPAILLSGGGRTSRP